MVISVLEVRFAFQIIQRIPMGSIIKTVTFYKRPFWREKGKRESFCSVN